MLKSREQVRRYNILDLGSSKICALSAISTGSDRVKILSYGISSVKGFSRGKILEPRELGGAIRNAVEVARSNLDYDPTDFVVGISGEFIRSQYTRGRVPVIAKDGRIGNLEIQHAIDKASSLPLPPDMEILHRIPVEFNLGDAGVVSNPLGMKADSLEVQLHLVLARKDLVRTIADILQFVGFNCLKVMVSDLGLARIALHSQELEEGVILLDLGSGKSSAVGYKNGVAIYLGILPIGGHHLTNDLAICLKTPNQEAEKLKVKYGALFNQPGDDEKIIKISTLGKPEFRHITKPVITEVLEPRAREMIKMMYDDISSSGYLTSFRSVILTGGTSNLPGMDRLVEKVFNLPTRLFKGDGFGNSREHSQDKGYLAALGMARYLDQPLGMESIQALKSKEGGFLNRLKRIFK